DVRSVRPRATSMQRSLRQPGRDPVRCVVRTEPPVSRGPGLPDDRQTRPRPQRRAADNKCQPGHVRGPCGRSAAPVRAGGCAPARTAVFPVLIVIEQIHREDTLPATARGYARDTLTLGWDDRLRVRGRGRSDGGIAFGLFLPRGTTLRGGDYLVLDEAKTVVVVVERPEPVFLIHPRTPQPCGLYPY